MESVEEALIRLEKLLQALHVSSSNSGKEQLKAACSDLEKMRKLKKEAEFLEASVRAKAASLQQVFYHFVLFPNNGINNSVFCNLVHLCFTLILIMHSIVSFSFEIDVAIRIMSITCDFYNS